MKKIIFILAFAIIGWNVVAQTQSRPIFSKKVISEMTTKETVQLIVNGKSDSTDIYAFEHMKTLLGEFMYQNIGHANHGRIHRPEDLEVFQQLRKMSCKNEFKDVVADIFLREKGWNYLYDICVFDSLVMPYCKSDPTFAKRVAEEYIEKINCTKNCLSCSTNMHYLSVFLTDKSFAGLCKRYQYFVKEKLPVEQFGDFSRANPTVKMGDAVFNTFLSKKISEEEAVELIKFRPSEANKIFASCQN